MLTVLALPAHMENFVFAMNVICIWPLPYELMPLDFVCISLVSVCVYAFWNSSLSDTLHYILRPWDEDFFDSAFLYEV